MAINFPTGLDDNSTLFQVVDGVTEILDEHHNNLKDAIVALERKVGIFNTSVATSLDYRLGHPSVGHSHNGASGQGPLIQPSTIRVPSGGTPSGGTLDDHFRLPHSATAVAATGIASVVSANVIFVPTQIPRVFISMRQVGSIGVGSKISAPAILGRTMQLESVQAGLKVGPSGATTGLIVRFGASNIYGASQGFGIRFAPGATAYRSAATPNVMTYPSGAVITLDAEAVGSNDPGQDARINFVFRE